MTEEQANKIIELLESIQQEIRDARADANERAQLSVRVTDVFDAKIDGIASTLDEIAQKSGGESIPPIGGA